MWSKIKLHKWQIIQFIVGIGLMVGCYVLSDRLNTHAPEALKEFKDGVQNHLIWDIKGQCFFVRPHSDVTVYLIRVTDCDRK
jgi:hypothetical protein